MSELLESNRQIAIEYHQKMISAGEAPYRLGLFYRKVLEASLWPTQSETARGLNVSQSQISKAISISGLPREVVDVFGRANITFRLGARLVRLVKQFGVEQLSRNVASSPTRAVTTDEALTWFARSVLPLKNEKVHLSLVDNGTAIRVDIPDPEQVFAHMGLFEDAFAHFIELIKGGFFDSPLAGSSGGSTRKRYVITKRRARKSNG